MRLLPLLLAYAVAASACAEYVRRSESNTAASTAAGRAEPPAAPGDEARRAAGDVVPVERSGAPISGAASPAPAIVLAKVMPPGLDPAEYLVSEKLDGVRAIWDGVQLRFRSGLPIAAPAWFTARLPAQALDGELWTGRGRFDEVSAIVRRAVASDAEWRHVGYHVFELPGAPGSFEQRQARIASLVASVDAPFLHAVEQSRVADRAALQRKLQAVLRAGGEGLMLHRADAPYLTGRSDALLKLKPHFDDEALVIGHVPGQGRHRGRLGALKVRTPDGREFRLGTGFTDREREHPPPLGATVTYTYKELTASGLPRFAAFLRVRTVP